MKTKKKFDCSTCILCAPLHSKLLKMRGDLEKLDLANPELELLARIHVELGAFIASWPGPEGAETFYAAMMLRLVAVRESGRLEVAS